MQGSETSVSCIGLEDSLLFPLRQGNSPIRLQEIELSGPFDPDMIPSLLPSLAFLTKLTLRLTGIHSLQMSMVLGSCDSLQDLFMSSDERMILPGPWVPPHFPPHHPGFLLRSLVLMNAQFQQRELESLLATTPRLKRLKIVNPIEGIFDNSGIGDVNHNPVLLVRSIKALSLNLEQCYFPHRFDTIASQTSLDICPTSPELVICLGHYSSFGNLSSLIPNPPNVVTTLEIVGRNNFYDGTSSKPLHQYLCSSPHLLHLKAPYVGFRVDHMDICGRVDHSSLLGTQRTATMKGMLASITTTALEYTPGIWACRDLKTLHLRILGPLDGCGYTEVRRAGCSRVVYGYISRVCPNLRDLYLASGDGYDSRLSGGCLGVQMSGGLCKLGRLQDLERLRIETRKAMPILPQDVEWIVEAGRTMEKKQERRRALAQWSTVVDMVQSAQDVHLKDKKDGLSWKGVEAWRMRRTLEHLGSLVDVRMAFEEMDGLEEEEKGKSPKEQGQQEQKFRMGEQTIMIEAQWDGKIYYHRMNEILDAFPTATGFEIDGDALDFLTKDNGDLCIPPIIGHFPNRIIDVVPGAPQGSSVKPRGPQAVMS
ncbi:hypothetical protein BGZ97_001328 [Linnemannia gamsii]|uniref:Uncharacterized protein n=1 Tax=Linnemannia gamsii TaxID=64522 RepID=A0A9P6RKK4_9FUNG|nr:hypothetical protein BGZ97_001328 [Linnemannia gamsii]